jgi:hypothetical protein
LATHSAVGNAYAQRDRSGVQRELPAMESQHWAYWPEQRGATDEAAEAIIRNRRLTKKQRAMLDWMVGNLAGRDSRTMIQAASEARITKGYASKIVANLADCVKLYC